MNYGDNDSYFTNALNSEYIICDDFGTTPPNIHMSHNYREEIVEETQLQSEIVSNQKVKDKKARTKNFSRQEDEMLISAWHNISADPIVGVDQTNTSYWQRVQTYFMKYKDFESNRNCCSLMHRWSVIQLAVNKFQGFYNQVNGRSGEDDKIRSAKDMYKEIHKVNFSLEHCWKILKTLPKWNIEFATKKTKGTHKESPTTPECVVLEKSEYERPVGRKAAKKIQKKRKRMENGNTEDERAAILEQIRADQLESRKQRSEHFQVMIQLAKQKAELDMEKHEREKRRELYEQDEADAKIMAMDTSTMGTTEIEYFNLRKQEIIERRRRR